MHETLLQVNGMPLALYEQQGDSLPVFFIHGLLSNSKAYELAWKQPGLKDLHLFAMDLPGHGHSGEAGNAAEYNILNFSKIAARVIEQKNLENVVIVGHSIGAHVAMHALEFSDQISGLMIIAAAPLHDAADMPRAYNLNEEITALLKGDVDNDTIYKAWLHDEKHVQAVRDGYDHTSSRCREMIANDLSVFFTRPDFFSENELLANRDVAMVQGLSDKLLNIGFVKDLKSIRSGKHALEIIPEAAHFPHLEAPEHFSRVLSGFVRKVSRGV